MVFISFLCTQHNVPEAFKIKNMNENNKYNKNNSFFVGGSCFL